MINYLVCDGERLENNINKRPNMQFQLIEFLFKTK